MIKVFPIAVWQKNIVIGNQKVDREQDGEKRKCYPQIISDMNYGRG